MKDKENINEEKKEGAIESDILEPFDMSQDNSVESDVTFVDSTEDGEELPERDKIKKKRDELKICRQEREEYLTGWQRAKADYINLQKELDEVRINSSIFAKENMLASLLPALDSFDMAFTNKDIWEKVDKEWRTGIEYIHQQFMSSLLNSGIEKIGAKDIPFDPQIHHSIKMVSTDDKDKDHIVAEVIQTGYKIGKRIIRPAGVNVYEFNK